jgi:NAD-dependent SIR2 family protein deacetylase
MSNSEPSRIDRLEVMAGDILQALREQRQAMQEQREMNAAMQEAQNADRASFLQALSQQQDLNAAMQETQNVDRAEFRAHVENTFEAITILAQNGDRQLAAIQEIQSEVRGLQTENRRILERLEAHFADGHGTS